MPPSFGGTRRWPSTRKPWARAAPASPRAAAGSGRFRPRDDGPWIADPAQASAAATATARGTRRRSRPRTSVAEIVGDHPHEAVRRRTPIRRDRTRAGELLELDRGLALVGDALAHPSSAATASNNRPMPDVNGAFTVALADDVPRLEGNGATGELELDGSHPPRLPDRRAPARQRHRLEVPRRSNAARSHGGARRPQRPVGAVARCRRRPAPAPARSRRARRGRRPYGRGGAARRRAGALLLGRPLRREVLRVEVVRDQSGSTPSIARYARDRRRTPGTPARSPGPPGGARGTRRRRA